MRKRCLTVQSSVKINFDKSNHHRTNLFIEAEPRISGTRSCCINCCLLLLLVAPSPPRPRWPTHITGKWGQRAGKESSVHGLSHRDLLEWGHADRNLFIGGYCNLALYIILPFLYFQIFVYIFIPPSLSRFEKFSRKEFLPFMQEVVTRSSVLFEESVYGIIYNYYLL